MKQETLLQIANRKLMSNDWLNGAEFGAIWQAEEMNYKDNLRQAYNAGKENINNCNTYIPFEGWFKQFKNNK